MADLGGPISLADQIRLVAGLRWRMLINGLRKKNNVLDLIGMGFVSLFALPLRRQAYFYGVFHGGTTEHGTRRQDSSLKRPFSNMPSIRRP